MFETLYAGTRGPGKTDALLMNFAQEVGKGFGAEWRGVIFRRTYPELQDIVEKAKKWFPRIWPDSGYHETKHQWEWGTGERLLFRHASASSDYWKYHGSAYTFIGWEELTTWPDLDLYLKMMSLCRSTVKAIPLKYRATTNPHGCVPYGDVLTDRGWVPIQEVTTSDRVVSVEPGGRACYAEVSGVVRQWYDGTMVSRRGSGLSMEFTEDHRMPLFSTDKTRHTLRPFYGLPGDPTLRRTSDGWDSLSSAPDTLGHDPGDFMELIGWFLSEGCRLRNTPNTFQIAQSKKEERKRIEALLARMGLRYTKDFQAFKVTDRKIREYLEDQGYSYEKFVPRELLNAPEPLLARLLESLLLGDGDKRGTYYTLSRQLADDVAEIGTKLGYSVYETSRLRNNRARRCYQVSLSERRTIRLNTGNHVYKTKTTCKSTNVNREHFTGMVYCLTVPGTETFFIRQNGCVWLSGNSGHNVVKTRFQLPVKKPGFIGPIITDPKTGQQRVAIHGSIYENKVLLHADPGYIQRIASAAPNKAVLLAWLEGDWDVVAGGMLDDRWIPSCHIIPSFRHTDVPRGWKIDRSYDHGQSKPFSVCWWAESDGTPLTLTRETYTAQGPTTETVTVGQVKGDIVLLDEWYGCEPNQLNTGLNMTGTEIAAGIRQRQEQWGIQARVRPGPADNSIFDSYTPGKSVAGDMKKAPNSIAWTRSDKTGGSRVQGWQQIRTYLKGASDQPRTAPGLFVCDRCTAFIQTVPNLPRSDRDPDDVDTNSVDHVGDAVRYRLRKRTFSVTQGDM